MSPVTQKSPLSDSRPVTADKSGIGNDKANQVLIAFANKIVADRQKEQLTLQGESRNLVGQPWLNVLAGMVPIDSKPVKVFTGTSTGEQDNANQPSNPTVPETVAKNLDTATAKYPTKDGKTADINRLAMHDLNRLERPMIGDGLGHDPIMVLSEGTKGTTVLIKNWKTDSGKMLSELLTPEVLEKYHFKLKSKDDIKLKSKDDKKITLEYDLKALTKGKPVALSTRRMFGKIQNPFDPSDVVMVYPAVKTNFDDMFGLLQWEPAIVGPEKVGLKTDPATVIIADPDGGYMRGLKKNYYFQAYEYGFIPEAFTHEGKQYVKLKFAPVEFATMTEEQKAKKLVEPITKEIGAESKTRYTAKDNTAVDINANFAEKFRAFLDNRVGGVSWLGHPLTKLPSFIPGNKSWAVSSSSPTSITFEGVHPEDVKRLTENAKDAAEQYGLTVKANGRKVTISYDANKIKDKEKEITFSGIDGEKGLFAYYSMFKHGVLFGPSDSALQMLAKSEDIKITEKMWSSLKDLAREMKRIGDASSQDSFKFDPIKILNSPGSNNQVFFEDKNNVYAKILLDPANAQLAAKHGFTVEKGSGKRANSLLVTFKGK
jgi:hypothetical protein